MNRPCDCGCGKMLYFEITWTAFMFELTSVENEAEIYLNRIKDGNDFGENEFWLECFKDTIERREQIFTNREALDTW